MLALLLATNLMTATPAVFPARPIRLLRPGEILGDVPAACLPQVTQVSGPSGFQPGVHKLGDLPPAHMEIAVERTVGGCPAPIIVRYDVEGDGRAAEGVRK